jgi:hypothetical protein
MLVIILGLLNTVALAPKNPPSIVKPARKPLLFEVPATTNVFESENLSEVTES